MRGNLYKGIYSRVARELGVAPSVVRRVGMNLGRSKRIERALVREAQRIERSIERAVEKSFDEDAA